MRVISWFVRLLLFLFLFALALNNMAPTDLQLLFGQQLRAPLFVLLLAAFVGGALAGSLALLPPLLKARRHGLNPPASSPAPRRADNGMPDGV